jgi:hypothetical protein
LARARAGCARRLRALASAAALWGLAALAGADTIHFVDGSALREVEVLAEQLDGVTYRRKGRSSEERAEAERVLAVERDVLPAALAQAERGIERGAFPAAIEQLRQYAVDALQSPKRDVPAWAAGYALDRALGLQAGLGDHDGAIATADMLQAKLPQSRHVPAALLAKASVQRAKGDAAAAQVTLDALRDLIVSRRLSERWSLELELARIEGYAELADSARRDRLREIAERAGSAWPPVRSRARLLEAESCLAAPEPDAERARGLCAAILADPIADARTLAGVHACLADCSLRSAGGKLEAGLDARAELEAAVLSAMRVVVLYDDQLGYAARCTYLAARASELLGDEVSQANARRLWAALAQRFPGSPWAVEARNSRR